MFPRTFWESDKFHIKNHIHVSLKDWWSSHCAHSNYCQMPFLTLRSSQSKNGGIYDNNLEEDLSIFIYMYNIYMVKINTYISGGALINLMFNWKFFANAILCWVLCGIYFILLFVENGIIKYSISLLQVEKFVGSWLVPWKCLFINKTLNISFTWEIWETVVCHLSFSLNMLQANSDLSIGRHVYGILISDLAGFSKRDIALQ